MLRVEMVLDGRLVEAVDVGLLAEHELPAHMRTLERRRRRQAG